MPPATALQGRFYLKPRGHDFEELHLEAVQRVIDDKSPKTVSMLLFHLKKVMHDCLLLNDDELVIFGKEQKGVVTLKVSNGRVERLF